jgi:hypothetical protein
MACAACLVIAGTMTSSVPALQQAQQAAEAKLAAFTDVAAFSALGLTNLTDYGLFDGTPALLAFLGGNPNLLLADDTNAGYAALSAIDVFFGDGANAAGGVFTGGGIAALANYDALSAIPAYVRLANGDITALNDLASVSAINPYIALAGGDITATGKLDSLSAVNTFFGNNNGEGGVFTGGGIDALAPNADGAGGYAALSALPVFFGRATTSTGAQTSFGPGVFNGGGLSALSNYDALSAVPAYLNLPPNPAPLAAAPLAARTIQQPVVQKQDVDTSLGAQPLAAVAPPADPAPADSTPPPAAPKSNNKQGEVRNSLSFKPEGSGNPLFLSGGGAGVDNSIRGYGDMLKKAGLSGGTSAPAGGASASGTP